MKKIKAECILLSAKLLIVIGLLITGWALYDQLPEQMPSHWNISGQADAYGSKLTGVLTIPLLILGMIVLFWFLPQIDPKKENYIKFEKSREIIQFMIISFLAYTQIISFFIVLHPNYSITPFILAGLGVLFIVLGNFMGKIRRNYFVGIKTPWTIDNEEVWNKTTRLSGWLWVCGGLLFLAQSFLMMYIEWSFIIIIALLTIIPIGYSYLEYKKLAK